MTDNELKMSCNTCADVNCGYACDIPCGEWTPASKELLDRRAQAKKTQIDKINELIRGVKE